MTDKERESVYAYGSMQDNRNERRGDDGQKRPQQTISDIIRGMQYAVNTAQDMLQQHQLELLEKYFNPETGEPYMRYVRLPDGRVVYVPVITLMPSAALAIDELEMDFSVRVAAAEVKHYTNGKEKSGRSSMQVYFSGTEDAENPGMVRIKMRFKREAEPESAARIREMLYSSVQ